MTARFSVNHRKASKFERRGLRSYFEYRDLGIGEVLMKAGSCFYQPPRIRHRELKHSRDLEMIEIVSPAKFKTHSVRALSPNL
jgi:hypothetical protein